MPFNKMNNFPSKQTMQKIHSAMNIGELGFVTVVGLNPVRLTDAPENYKVLQLKRAARLLAYCWLV